MPQHSLEDAKFHLNDAMAILETRIAELADTDPLSAFRDRLVVARECVRDAIDE